MVTPWVKRNAENTQVNSENPPRLLTIVGIAVATIVASTAAIKLASIMANKISGLLTEPVSLCDILFKIFFPDYNY